MTTAVFDAWGAQSRSRCEFVFMEQPPEEVAPPDLRDASRGLGWRIESAVAIWWSELEELGVAAVG